MGRRPVPPQLARYAFRRNRTKSRMRSQITEFGPSHFGPKNSFVPNVITMFWRYLFLTIIQIGWMVFSSVIIMGEDVFWRLAFVDQLYTNMGTNTLDVWTTVYLTGYMLIWGIGVFWAVGVFDWLSK